MQPDKDRLISEEYRIVAKQWVEADAAANLLEECKSATLAQHMTKHGDIAVSKAEMLVKASDDWKEYLDIMVKARERANRLKVQLEYIRMQFQEWTSKEATKRHEMRM